MQQLEQWRSNALLAHEYTRQRMKDRIKSTVQPFKKGDKVWLEGTNLKLGYNKKITTKREGPFTITEVLGPVNYRLKLPDKWRMRDNFHATLLTPYEENATHGKNFPHPPLDIIEGEQEWEVEQIVNHKGKKNRQYQVKWRGYEEMTWEPEENLQHLQDTCKILSPTTRKGKSRSQEISDVTDKRSCHHTPPITAYTLTRQNHAICRKKPRG
jgi:hypothetical protein